MRTDRQSNLLPNDLYRTCKIGVIAHDNRCLESPLVRQVHQVCRKVHVGALLAERAHGPACAA